MKNRFSTQFSDEDLDLYLGGKVTQNLTASIEEHYFGASATGHPSDARRREAIVIAATVASLLPLASLRLNQKPQLQTMSSAIATPALPFASAIVASIDLFAPSVLPVTTPAVRRPPQAEQKAPRLFQRPPQRQRTIVRIETVDPPAVAFYSNAIPELPFESEVPPIPGPQKRHRLRRFLSGAMAPLRLLLSLDRSNRGV
jgi:hypothetical protein